MNEQQPSEAPLVEMQPNENKPPESQPQDPSRRLRELLAIPERERSDALWDEIIGLEIQLAPGNRASSPHADPGRPQEPGRRQETGRRQDQRQDQNRRQDPTSGAKSTKRFFKKPRRGPGTPSGKR